MRGRRSGGDGAFAREQTVQRYVQLLGRSKRGDSNTFVTGIVCWAGPEVRAQDLDQPICLYVGGGGIGWKWGGAW